MLEIKNICAGYGKENILKNVSLNIKKGSLVSIIGPNGSGKSTMLKALTGILPISSGDILLNNKPVSSLTQQKIATKIAYLAQGKNIPDMTVEQMVLHGRFPHLKFPRKYSKKDYEISEAALMQLKISDLAKKPLSSLSGGMRQKAYIAMALAQSTDYILLDEPTTYLDISNQLSLLKILRSLADSGKSIVTVMHDLPLAFSFSDNVLVFKDGRIIASDTPESLCKSDILKKVFGAELEFYKEKNCFFIKYN